MQSFRTLQSKIVSILNLARIVCIPLVSVTNRSINLAEPAFEIGRGCFCLAFNRAQLSVKLIISGNNLDLFCRQLSSRRFFFPLVIANALSVLSTFSRFLRICLCRLRGRWRIVRTSCHLSAARTPQQGQSENHSESQSCCNGLLRIIFAKHAIVLSVVASRKLDDGQLDT